jgi:hypothetical protein
MTCEDVDGDDPTKDQQRSNSSPRRPTSRRTRGADLPISVKIEHVQPSPRQALAWRRLWDRLLSGIELAPRSSAPPNESDE